MGCYVFLRETQLSEKLSLIFNVLEQSLRAFCDNLYTFYKHPRINGFITVDPDWLMSSFVSNKFRLIFSALQQSLRAFCDNLFAFYNHPRINNLITVQSDTRTCPILL